MANEQSDVLDRVEKRLPELPADKPSADMSPPPVASSPGIADFAKVPEGLKSDLVGAVRGKQQAVAGVNAQTDRRVEEDRTRALQLGATGVGPESEIKPWDAKAKAQEYSHDPLDSFGSFASIFAITASAFTKAPFENALNGSAAAINAIKAGDEKGYDRAYTAWKDNNELAIKRANLQHQKYQEAMDLMKTDMNRGAAKALAVAAQFDDQKTIALIQNGMIPEFFQTQAASVAATEGIAKAGEGMEKQHYQRKAALQLKQEGKTDAEIYQQIYAPVGSQSLGVLKSSMIRAEAAANGGDMGAAARKVEAEFRPTAEARNAGPKYSQEVLDHLNKQGISLDPGTRSLITTVMQSKNSAKVAEMNGRLAEAISGVEQEKSEKGEAFTNEMAAKIIRDSVSEGQMSKVDQGILNQLPKYPGMTRQKLGYIAPKNQERIANAWQSAEQIQHIADYAATNPEAVGLMADSARKVNVDAYKDLISKPSDYIVRLTQERDKAIDASAASGGLASGMAEKAKVLNKMLATQAFADAAQAGSRGATIYLDKAFREIYQQASSLPVFFDILHQRMNDSNNLLSKYDLALSNRTDASTKYGFWSNEPEYLKKSIESGTKAPATKPAKDSKIPAVGQRQVGKEYDTPRGKLTWGGDGFWYSQAEWSAKNAGK